MYGHVAVEAVEGLSLDAECGLPDGSLLVVSRVLEICHIELYLVLHPPKDAYKHAPNCT